MPVLYRKYRPQRFEEIVGQGPIVATLRNAVRSGAVAHAYLFTGSRGVGKTSVARILAKAINCLDQKDGDACGICEVCVAVAEGRFLDLVEIDAASHTGVENVRELIEHVKFQPSLGTYKVFIIDEVHMLSKAAFNALLKTLEEPPQHAVFILATTDIHKVPETIISRTQRFDFRRISAADTVAHLQEVVEKENLVLSKEILELIANSAQGGLRDAMSLLDKVTALGAEITLTEAQLALGVTSLKLSQQITDLIAQRQAAELPALFEDLLMNGTDFAVLNRDLLEYLRKVLVYKITGTEAGLNILQEDLAALRQQAENLSIAETMHIIRLFLRSYKDMATAPSPELPLLLSAIEASIKNDPSGKVASPVLQTHTASIKKPAFAVKPLEAAIAEPEMEIMSATIVEEPVVPDELLATLESTSQPVTLEEVTGFWPQVLDKVKSINSPLATLVKNSPILTVEGDTITLAVKYLFHKEHLESKKNYAFLTGVIQEISGKRVRLLIRINKQPDQGELSKTVDAISDALKVFGGELVE
jgi:DNA polymerase III subunit gamma/tau